MSESPEKAPGRSWTRRILWGLLAVPLLVLLYYAGGAFLIHTVDDDPSFGLESTAPEGGSRMVAVMADVIEREVDQHAWVANDPFFKPGWVLDNMPNYQQGIVQALSRVAIELTDQLARSRGASAADPDLEAATGELKFPGDQWVFNLDASWAPQRASESYYRKAVEHLRSYNQRLSEGNAVLERRADNLRAAIDRISKDVGSASAALNSHIEENAGVLFDFQADDLFYRTKGRLYAYYLVLRELEKDFAGVIEERRIDTAWQDMLSSLEAAIALDPWVIVNGSPDAQFRPSHLTGQGFFLLRARTQIGEIADILDK